MIKTFKKALAIMMTIVFVISLVPVIGLASTEEGTIKTESIAFSNTERIDYGYTRSDKNHSQWNHRPATCYIRSSYPTFVQIDLAGYEEVLKNENTKVYMNLVQASTSYPLTGTVDAYLAADNCDQLSFSDATTFNHTIAVSSGFYNKQRPLFFNIASASSICSSGELTPDTLVSVLDENYENSKIALYMQGSAKGSLNSTTSFNIVYDESEINNEDYVSDLANKLTWDIISTESRDDVGADLNLPSKFYGADVKWTSTVPEVIDPVSGEVTPNLQAETTVNLYAKLTYTNFAGEVKSADTQTFTVKVTKPKYDYTTGNGSYYDGIVDFITRGSASGGDHVGTVTKVSGIAGKEDACYMLQDAVGKTRYDLVRPTTSGNSYRNTIEFSICVPSDAYGYLTNIRVYTGISADDSSSAVSELRFMHDGIYLNRGGKKLISWDGDKWHHVAVQVPGIVSSDASGITYDRTLKIYVDGVCEYNLDLEEEDFPAPHGINYVQTNGLCLSSDYIEDGDWDTVACYLDNIRWTHDAYVADYNTKSSVASTYDIDSNADMLTVVTAGTTVKDIVNSLTIDEDAVARIYDVDFNLVDDDALVADGYTLVVADTNGTTSERSYVYYDIRVIDDGEFAFDVPFIAEADGAVNGTVKLFNNTAEKKTYKVYLAVYNDDNELLELKPATLEVESGKTDDVTTESASFEDGNFAKLFIWESDDITPALSSVYFK